MQTAMIENHMGKNVEWHEHWFVGFGVPMQLPGQAYNDFRE